MSERKCELCRKPLPEGCDPHRKYHVECAKTATTERQAAYHSLHYRERKHRSVPRKRNPMLYLGMDYTELKLNGMIKKCPR